SIHMLLARCLALRNRHSFPTRRSSDLAQGQRFGGKEDDVPAAIGFYAFDGHARSGLGGRKPAREWFLERRQGDHFATRFQEAARSEEHTSELQSPDHLVCRLLLEKKKE